MNKAVFIDRDGTINTNVPYCRRPEDFELLPGAAEGIKLLNEHGFKVVMVTNQSGLGRNYFTGEMLAMIHEKMRRELAENGAYIDAIYYCPHHPDDGCECRKPSPKMVFQAAQDLNIELPQSWFIGDSHTDIMTGDNAGCKTVLITTDDKDNVSSRDTRRPDYTSSSIIAAARYIIADTGDLEKKASKWNP